MEGLQLGTSNSELMQRCLYPRFSFFSLREVIGRFEGANEILSTNGSCESGLADHPVHEEDDLIFA